MKNPRTTLHRDPNTGEPYLRVPSPLDNIIITTPRQTDAAALANILSQEDVSRWLAVIPKHYTIRDAENWLKFSIPLANKALKELEEAGAAFVGTCPFRTIREVRADGTQITIGSVAVGRSPFSYLDNAEEARRLAVLNKSRDVGDPEIIWELGDYLSPTHHSRGIMSAVIRTIVHEWIVPFMGGHHVIATPYIGNAGSVRVFEKNGFVLEKEIRQEITNAAGIKHVGQSVMRWDKE
ncbi:hypothetical protein BXZ70DRAFT_1008553 [Cristinia sonorae]|uniref:N-acetyltransferase domain-containing protein n=1 Tax=Cristinia sonorae TaxID=1940300 RepID=A0A8K0UMF8_9AGAR|nr:hypothetical protein BXZ70DRAFT_1008553 [Cristinia sonorae]